MHVFERVAFPLLAVVFLIGAAIIFHKAHLGAGGHPIPGAFLIETAAAFGYACGWNPYASDYTRYLARDVSKVAVGVFAGLGVFISCVVLEAAGAAMVSAAGIAADVDPGIYTGLMPTFIGKLTLLCIAVGAVCANALNIYSGAMSALALGLRLPGHRARAIVAVVFGVCGFVLALFGIKNAGTNYENFLLVIAYWIGPWLGVVLVDRWRRQGQDLTRLALKSGFHNPRGAVAMGVGMVLSIWLFSNQTEYVGRLVRHHGQLGDITFLVGFAGGRRHLPRPGEAAARVRRGGVTSDQEMLAVAVEEARAGLAEGGVPVGGALFGADGTLLGRGHNRRVQDDDPSVHGETAAFKNAGRQRSYRGTTMATTLSPCWFCSGLIRQFGISRVVIGEARTFYGGHDWLAENGVEVVLLDDHECVDLMSRFIAEKPEVWFEDIGED